MLKVILFAAVLGAVITPALRAATPASIGPQYCVSSGGAVVNRIPTYGTNGGTPLPLVYARPFCEYTSADGTTHIDVLLDTLIAKQPTLAALAYYAKVKFDGSTCQGSPGSCYCSQIGGTDLFGGINAAGGGWVLRSDSTNVLDVCAFPDLSAMDAYGLFYHSASIIRGANLAHKLRYPNPYK